MLTNTAVFPNTVVLALMENDLFQLWRLVTDFWDQLAQNRALTASLQAQAGSVKVGTMSRSCDDS
jgi:hypothetical protein